jgi:hypothetical protein
MKPGGKILNALLALALVAAFTWAFVRFAPVPEPAQGEQIAAAPTPTRPAPAAPAPASPSALATGAGDAPAQPDLLGGRVASGRVEESAPEYARRLETLYRGRGYRDFGAMRRPAAGAAAPESKLYWRRQYEGSEMVCAIGDDADPDGAGRSPEMEMFVSVISPGADGGATWTRHRYSTSPGLTRREGLDGGDFPGQDPPQVPRHGGLRRLFSVSAATPGDGSLAVYEGGEEPSELSAWYRSAMAASWRYEAAETADAAELAGGAMYFTRGGRLCLVWVTRGMTSRSLVVVSVRGG